MFLLRTLCNVAVACGMLTVSLSAAAQPAGAKGDDFLYRVVRGDTLGDLAQRYTAEFSNWAVLQRINEVADPRRLPISRLLRIPFSMIPVRGSAATVLHIAGQASVNGQPLSASGKIEEGQTVKTASNGFVTLRLADGSIVSIPASTSLTLTRLREFVGTGLTDSILKIDSGSVETRVAPNETGVGRFEVRTPVSVTGVRGTSLRVHADETGSRSEVLSGQAGVDGSAASEVLVRRQQGLAVDRGGRSMGVRTLLPAPQLAEPKRGPQGWSMAFAPVDGAASYVVSVAKDEHGGILVSQRQVDASPVHFAASGPGTHYVFVRALDADGMGGPDARQAFEGNLVLLDGAGSPILTESGGLVMVADY